MSINLINFRCRNFWPPIRLFLGKKRLPHSSVCIEHHLWLLNGLLPKLLHLCPTPSSYRLQHRRSGPLCIRSRHRACWPKEARCSRNVHILLLLNWHCTCRWPCLHFPIMACTLHCYLHSIPPLSSHCPPFHLRVPEVVPRPRKSKGSHATHACHCRVQWKSPP